jgi:hypothetical protein
MKKIFLLFIILFFCNSFAHKGIKVKKEYGNILITSITEDYVEDINKALIVGQYAEMLAKEYSYSNKIYIHFIQNDKVYINSWFPPLDEDSEYSDGLNIMIEISNFDVVGALNVIEDAIKKSDGKKLSNNEYLSIYNKKESEKISKVLETKIERPSSVEDLNKPEFLTYYFKDGK